MPPMGEYNTSQICLNGYLVNEYARTMPLHNSPHCTKCGAETITACKDCQTAIRGAYHSPGVITAFVKRDIPAFCQNCGKAFPWTASALEAARFLADETDSLSPAEREQLKATLADLVQDTPRTALATTRFKKFMLKAGKETAQAFRDIFVDIVSDSVKKSIWG